VTSDVLRILLIEDNAGDVRLIREMFGRERADSFEIIHVSRMSQGVSHLAKGETDIVLVDMGLPDEHGLGTVRRAKAAAAPAVPVIVLTGLDDETLAADAMRAGAEDYLIKGQIESRALPRALRHAIERQRLRTEADLLQTHQIKLKEQFLSHVSHELRSPLTAIYQFVTILLDGLSGELNVPQRQNVAIILKNVEQLRAMIDDLLDLTRVQSGKLVIERQSMSMTEAMTDAMHTLEGAAAQKGITLSSNLECRLPLVFADPVRMRQVLIALLDNAIKFTPVNGWVSVLASVPDDDSSFVILEVSDSGGGISHGMAESIFSREFQANPALEGRRGLGLGLFICHELVTRQGGQISAGNLPGGGAIFTVTVPVASLANLIAPLLSNLFSTRAPFALVCVESDAANGWPSNEARAQWSGDSRAVVERCLLRASDRLLPQSDSGGCSELMFVVAFGDGPGIATLSERIREQLVRLELFQKLGLSVSVSHQFAPSTAADNATPPEETVQTAAATMATFISAEISARSVRS
jgi:signal transduction histidine kinase